MLRNVKNFGFERVYVMLRNVKITMGVYYGQMGANEQTETYQGPWPC